MRTIVLLLGALAAFGGMFFIGWAIATPLFFYDLKAATSAVQITQVYSTATYQATVAVGLFLFALLCVVGGRRQS